MNFEVIDNIFQVAAMSGAALASIVLALRHKSRHYAILALAYASFAMGTLYYVLHLAIIGDIPHLFYVSEVSWIASYLFFLSLLILRTERSKLRLSPFAGIGTALTGSVFLYVRILPSLFVSLLFELTLCAIVYLTIFHLQNDRVKKPMDFMLLLCVPLQLSVYMVSGYIEDFTHFNPYFAVDIALTLSLVSILPLTAREVTRK